MSHRVLSKIEIEKALAELKGWQLKDDELVREFTFRTFSEAFAFMTRVAMCAEKLNHHPDWSNSYNKVLIRLVTHQTNAITEHDIELAQAIQKLA